MHSQPSRPTSDRSHRRRPLVVLLATVGLLVFAASASASSLLVTVTPTTVRINHVYTLKVRGSSDGPAVPNGPRQRVRVYSQRTWTRCASTSAQEIARSYSSLRLGTFVNPGPFQFTQHVNANRLGNRRICAYLDYGPNTSPQLTASARYVVKLPLCTRFRRTNCSRT